MYPRNAASPERVAIGAVVLIADGTVQTSAVTVTVRGQGGAEAGSAGTIAFGASGIVYYTPTQAETDFTSFVLIASKASCLPVAVTVITSASVTPGHAGLDWGKVINPTTAVGLTNTTIAVTQKVDVETIKTNPVVNGGTATFPTNATLASTTNITAGTMTTVTNLTNAPTAGDFTATMKTSIGTAVAASAVASVTAGVTVTTNNDKTGYTLSATGSAALTESYAADGAAFTLNQGVYMIWSILAERSRSGTTLTAGKLDGTPAMTFTLDSAVAPSSQTRA